MTTGNDKLLRRSLIGNAVFSIVSGVSLALFSSRLGEFMDVNRTLLLIIGLGVIGFGIATAWVATRGVIDLRLGRSVVVADIAWVVTATVIIIFTDLLTNRGQALLGEISLFVGVFAVLQIRGIHRIEGPKRLVTEIEIAAAPEDVWELLTNFEDYSDWNPHITEGSGQPRVGERLELAMSMGNGRHTTMRPTVTEAVPGQSFEWLGHLGVKGVFDGRHRFDLEAVEGQTRMIHSEEFTGILVPALKSMLDGKTRAGFEAMNEAVKNRVEAKEPQEA